MIQDKYLLDFIEYHPKWKELLAQAPYHLRIQENGNRYIFTSTEQSDMTNNLCRCANGIIVEVREYLLEYIRLSQKVGMWDKKLVDVMHRSWYQYEGMPDNTMVRMPRIIVRGFDKFFKHDDFYAATIDWSSAQALEKIDGTLVRYTTIDDQLKWFVDEDFDASRSISDDFIGSPDDYYDLIEGIIGETHMMTSVAFALKELGVHYYFNFELVSPWNSGHNESKLYWLSVRHKESGLECLPQNMMDLWNKGLLPHNSTITESAKSAHEVLMKAFPRPASFEVRSIQDALDRKKAVIVHDSDFNLISIGENDETISA